jgi:hypothetical protein
MGQVIRKAIRNILEAPLDVIIDLAGRGLEKIVDEGRELPQLAVKCGDGVKLDEEFRVKIDIGRGLAFFNGQVGVLTGSGLGINHNNEVVVKPGDGIEVKEDKVHVKPGDGLGIVDGEVGVLPGDNIVIRDGKVSIDNTIEECNCGHDSYVIDSKLELKGRQLIFHKKYQDFKFTRNKAGFLLDMVMLGTRDEKDIIDLPADPGYVAMLSVPNRETTAKSPNFYKK